MAVFAPMPSAMARTATVAKLEFFLSRRNPKRVSRSRLVIFYFWIQDAFCRGLRSCCSESQLLTKVALGFPGGAGGCLRDSAAPLRWNTEDGGSRYACANRPRFRGRYMGGASQRPYAEKFNSIGGSQQSHFGFEIRKMAISTAAPVVKRVFPFRISCDFLRAVWL